MHYENCLPKTAPSLGETHLQKFCIKSDLYKTELCKNYLSNGICRYENKCQFAHGEEELRLIIKNTKYKTKVCTQYKKQGFCKYGNRCLFIHDPSEKERLVSLSEKAAEKAQIKIPAKVTNTNIEKQIKAVEATKPNLPETKSDSLNNLGMERKFNSLFIKRARNNTISSKPLTKWDYYSPMLGSRMDEADLMASDSSESEYEDLEDFKNSLGFLQKDEKSLDSGSSILEPIKSTSTELQPIADSRRNSREEENVNFGRNRASTFDFSNLYKNLGYKKNIK